MTRIITGLLILVSALTACGRDTIEPVSNDPETLFWRLDINRPAILMSVHSPYDTVRLVGTPVNIYGKPVPLTEPVIFSKVTTTDASFDLTPDGVITAKSTTTNGQVLVSLTMNGIKRTANVQIRINNEWPVRKYRAISVQPLPPDSNTRWLFAATANLAHRAYYAQYTGTDSVVPNTVWKRFFLSRNPGIFDYGAGKGAFSTTGAFDERVYDRIGEAWIVLRAFVYGDDLVDSVLVRRVDVPLKVVDVMHVPTPSGGSQVIFQPKTLTIDANMTVSWNNIFNRDVVPGLTADTVIGGKGYVITRVGDSVDVTFDDPSQILPGQRYTFSSLNACKWVTSACTFGSPGNDPTGLGGNISSWAGIMYSPLACTFACVSRWDAGYRDRKFPIPGTYQYRSTRYPDAQGTIIVR